MKPRLSVVTFAGSSNKLRAKALTRVGLIQSVKPAIFNVVVINTRFRECLT